MSATLAAAGWGMAAVGWTAAALVRHQLAQDHAAVARASHELRGPLTAVRLGLESRRLPPTRLEAIDLELGRAALALEDLTVVWQRRRAGDIRWHDEPVDMAELLAESVEAWRPAARAAGASLRFLGVSEAAVVRGDRLRLAQAVGNLIANAIEHGGGEVRVSLYRAQGRLRIDVVDDGPGLPRPMPGHSRWKPSSKLGRRGANSRGHGLAIASAVAAAHDGRLAAAPSDRGARLVLELPDASISAGYPVPVPDGLSQSLPQPNSGSATHP